MERFDMAAAALPLRALRTCQSAAAVRSLAHTNE
jgi:hypothetical protein